MDYDSVNVSALTSAVNSCKSSLGKDKILALESEAKGISWDGSLAKDNLITGISNIISKVNSIDKNLTTINSIASMISTYQSYTQQIKSLQQARDSLKVSYWTTKETDSEGNIKTITHSNASEISAKRASYNSQISTIKTKQNQVKANLDSML